MKLLSSKNGKRWMAVALVPLAVLVSEATAWWWMNPSWASKTAEVLSYRFPQERPGHLARRLDPGVATVLKCDAGEVGLIGLGRTGVVEVNYFEWDSTDRKGLMEAFAHSPEICMGAIGSKVEKFLPSRTYQLNGQELVFDVTLFRDREGGPVYIFKAPWAEGLSGINLLREGPYGANVRQFKFVAVSERWKPRFARVMMAGVTGVAEEEDAWRYVQEAVLKDLQLVEVPVKP